MQHVLLRPDHVPEHPRHLLGQDLQDHEPRQQGVQGQYVVDIRIKDMIQKFQQGRLFSFFLI